MARGRCTFKQQDVTRAARGVVAAGIEIKRIEIDRDGRIVVVTADDGRPPQPDVESEPTEIIL